MAEDADSGRRSSSVRAPTAAAIAGLAPVLQRKCVRGSFEWKGCVAKIERILLQMKSY